MFHRFFPIVLCLLAACGSNGTASPSTASTPGPGGCTPLPASATAWWPFDEVSGSSVTDIVGGHTGTTHPGSIGALGSGGPVTSTLWPPPTFTPKSIVGDSLFFYANLSVSVPSAPTLEPGVGDFTFDTWVIYAPAATGRSFQFASKQGASGSGWSMYIVDTSTTSGQLVFKVVGSATATASVTVSPSVWHHVAGTVARGGSTDTITGYLDGTAFTSGPAPALGNVSNAADVQLGGNGVSAGELALDEVEIFNGALSQQQIQLIYNARSAGKCRPSTAPTASPT